MGKTLTVTSYYLNKTYISQELCVNKAKPRVQCNGKCYLKKQLKKEEDRHKDSPVQQEKLPDLFWIEHDNVEKPFYAAIIAEEIVPYLFHYQYLFYSYLFHPPACV